MEEQKITLLLDDSIVKTFVKAIEFYKLTSGYTNYGENIEECQKIKEQIINCISPNMTKQEIVLLLKTYNIGVLLNAIEFFNLANAFLGNREGTEDCQIIRDEFVNCLLEK